MTPTIQRWIRSFGVVLLVAAPSICRGQGYETTPRVAAAFGEPIFSSAGPTKAIIATTSDTLEDRNGSILVGNPDLDGPRPRLGCFATVDAAVLGAHVNNELIAPVNVGPVTDLVALPSAPLEWTASPRFELGYRFGQGAGDLSLSYRFLAASGSDTTPAFDAAGNAGSLRSRFELHVVDLDYANLEPSLLPGCEMSWRVGIRGESLFFDSQEVSPLRTERVRNSFGGAGPHASLAIWRPMISSNVGLFGKADVAGVLGQVRQRFDETLVGIGAGDASQAQTMPTVTLSVEAGFGWTPTATWRLTAAYIYEHWWDATYSNNSRGDVMTQGFRVGAEWKY
jgi:hypothetical protein